MNIDLLVNQLIQEEGLRLKPYQDTVGKWTIGIGRNLTDRGISESEAYTMLHNDIRECEARLDMNLPFWRQLSDIRQRVLVDMCFNLGIQGLLDFHNTLNALANSNYQGTANGMRASKWAEQVGKRAERLARMMESNQDVKLSEIK